MNNRRWDYSHGPVWYAFGMSYSAYFVMPRRTLQSMPSEWQARFVAMMEELESTLVPESWSGEYTVNMRKGGRFVKDPMAKYRHADPVDLKDCGHE